MQIYVSKTNFHSQNTSQRTSAGTRPEAGRQNFERIPTAIRGRKKPFANRIREFNVYCDLKTMKNEYISTKRIPENLRRNLPDVRPTSAGSRTAKF